MTSPKPFVSSIISRQTALFSVCALAGLAVASPVSAATLFVDDDQPSNAFPTIQAAIQAAAPGDTIRVLPGTYFGPIVVDKSLRIQGTGPDDFQTTPPTPGDNDPTVYSVVRNTGLGGFDVAANDVNINRFRIVGNPSSTNYPNAGINLRPGSGRVSNFNVFENNGLGIYVEGAETGLDVNINAFYGNFRADGGTGGGLFAPLGGVSTSFVRNNRFLMNGQFSVNFGSGAGAIGTGLTISGNTADQERTFAVVGFTSGTRITTNIVTNLAVSGLVSFGRNTSMVISQNTFQGIGAGSGGGSGIRLITAFGNTVGDVTPTVTLNTISGFRFDGIALRGVSGAVVRDNETSANGRYGIWLESATTARVQLNDVVNNLVAGIRAESAATNNTIGGVNLGNILSGNTLDASDASTGNRTAGTANTWRANTGVTSNPPGLLNN